jgi:RNA polymerase sigma-70 factor (ECF subfamily)
MPTPALTMPGPVRRRPPAAGTDPLAPLARAAADGVPGAASELIAATRGDVTRFIAGRTDPDWVEDLTQETFIRALGSLPRFTGRSSVRTWLLSIARHTVVDRYRARAARPHTTPLPEGADRMAPAGGAFEEEIALHDLLGGLAEARRRAFVLTRLEGFSYAEVASMTGVPVGTVRSRVARARVDLVAALRRAESAG